jgi:hypothetical protein
MAKLTTGILGYTEETTFGVRVDPSDSQLRRFGLETTDWDFPKELVEPNIQMVSSSYDPATLTYGNKIVKFSTPPYVLIDVKELSYIAATVNTLESGTPDKRHSIVPVEPATAYAGPSRTIHSETAGVVLKQDAAGCVVEELNITCVKGDPRGPIITESFVGQRITDDDADYTLIGTNSGAVADPEGVEGQYVANDLDNANPGPKPITFGTSDLRAVAGYETSPKAFVMPTSLSVIIGGTTDLDTGNPTTYGNVAGGTDLTSYCKKWGIKVAFAYDTGDEQRPNRTGTNNYNQSIQAYLMGVLLTGRTINVTIELDPETTPFTLIDDMHNNVSTNELYFKVQKSDDSDDWIVFALAPATGGTVSNLLVDMQGKINYKAISGPYTFNYTCKNIIIVGGNAFDTCRSLSGT